MLNQLREAEKKGGGMNIENERKEMTLIVRDESGMKLYAIIKLNGEAGVFDYITKSKSKIGLSELFDWLREHDIGLEVDRS